MEHLEALKRAAYTKAGEAAGAWRMYVACLIENVKSELSDRGISYGQIIEVDHEDWGDDIQIEVYEGVDMYAVNDCAMGVRKLIVGDGIPLYLRVRGISANGKPHKTERHLPVHMIPNIKPTTINGKTKVY